MTEQEWQDLKASASELLADIDKHWDRETLRNWEGEAAAALRRLVTALEDLVEGEEGE